MFLTLDTNSAATLLLENWLLGETNDGVNAPSQIHGERLRVEPGAVSGDDSMAVLMLLPAGTLDGLFDC